VKRPGWFRDRSSLAASLGIVLAFALFSVLWISLTDRILGWMVQDHDLLVRLATYKGFFYILITSGLLYWLVFTALELKGGSPLPGKGSADGKGHGTWVPALLLGCAVLVVEGLGYGAYRYQARYLERDAQERMTYLASKKADWIDSRLNARIADAEVTATDPLLRDQLRALGQGAGPGSRLRRQLEARLAVLRRTAQCLSVHLLGPGGRPLAATDDGPLLSWEAQGLREPGAWTGPRLIWSVGGEPGRGPRLVLACLARIQEGSPARELGSLVFRLDPDVILGGATVGGWPTSSPSGETLVVARQGEDMVYLNRTRRPGDPVFTMPLARTELVGVKALLAGDGTHLGKDYQGVPTVAVSRHLKFLPWVLLVKLDRDEYLLPVQRLVRTYEGLGGLFLVVSVAFLAAWLQRERARELAELGRVEAESRARGQQLELLSRYGNDIVLVLDAAGQVLEANDRAVASYQHSREQLRRMKVQDLRAPAGLGDYPQQFAEVKQKSTIRFQTVHRRRDGSTFPVEVSSRAFELDGRSVVQSIIRDITEQREYEARIQALNESLERRVLERTAQLETAFREMEAFSYSVSHDLRGPLRGIDGFGYALQEEYGDRLDEQGRHYLERIRAGAQRMGLIMDDLLDLSRLNRQALTRTSVDLSAQARRILDRLAREEPGARQVAVAVQDGLLGQADPRLMDIALGQLLANAWKFTARRSQARIEFGAVRDPEGGPAFFVRDNGAGFDMAYAGKLFGAFQRLHDASEFSGTGIGLAIAQRIMARHGGRIWAEAAVDQGATFFFTLPD